MTPSPCVSAPTRFCNLQTKKTPPKLSQIGVILQPYHEAIPNRQILDDLAIDLSAQASDNETIALWKSTTNHNNNTTDIITTIVNHQSEIGTNFSLGLHSLLACIVTFQKIHIASQEQNVRLG